MEDLIITHSTRKSSLPETTVLFFFSLSLQISTCTQRISLSLYWEEFMAEDMCFFTKDTLVIKAPKKSSLALRRVVLLFAMACGVYICLVSLKQTSSGRKIKFLNIQVIDQPSLAIGVENLEEPFLHFPKPKTFSREECGHNPVRFFVILSMQRSGSGWFETLLNSHANVSSNGEIFSIKERRGNISSIINTLDRVYNLDYFTSASKNECSAAIGFKWMLNQGLMEYHEDIVEYFNRRGVSIVFLFRQNLLRRFISVLANSYDSQAKLLNGTHKSHVHSPKEAQILSKYKPKINATLLLSNLKEAEETIRKALEYFNSTRHIVLTYEDVVKNTTKLVEVQEFLKLPPRELTSRQVKIHNGPLSQQIENWNDVKEALTGTSYQRFLHVTNHRL